MVWFEILLKWLVGPFSEGGLGLGGQHSIYASDEGGPEADPDG